MGRAGETVVTSTCGHNCGGRCVVNAHVVDERIVKISTDPARWRPELPPLHACARGMRWRPELPPLHACARGIGRIERVYHPERLKYPMRRVGPRNSGQFERISWDEALDHVAAELLRIRQVHGNAAILDCSRSGNTSMLHGFGVPKRFFYKFGGCTELWSNMSAEAEIFAVRMTYGAKADYKSAGREPTDYVNSKLILMWGWSPPTARSAPAPSNISRRPGRRACASCASTRGARVQASRWPTSMSSSSRRPMPRP